MRGNLKVRGYFKLKCFLKSAMDCRHLNVTVHRTEKFPVRVHGHLIIIKQLAGTSLLENSSLNVTAFQKHQFELHLNEFYRLVNHSEQFSITVNNN